MTVKNLDNKIKKGFDGIVKFLHNKFIFEI